MLDSISYTQLAGHYKVEIHIPQKCNCRAHNVNFITTQILAYLGYCTEYSIYLFRTLLALEFFWQTSCGIFKLGRRWIKVS